MRGPKFSTYCLTRVCSIGYQKVSYRSLWEYHQFLGTPMYNWSILVSTQQYTSYQSDQQYKDVYPIIYIIILRSQIYRLSYRHLISITVDIIRYLYYTIYIYKVSIQYTRYSHRSILILYHHVLSIGTKVSIPCIYTLYTVSYRVLICVVYVVYTPLLLLV